MGGKLRFSDIGVLIVKNRSCPEEFSITKKIPLQKQGQWCYYALSTLPDLKQEVHTYVFLAPPSAVLILTDFTLDFHILLDLLCE